MKMFINRPTAQFLTIAHYVFGGDQDAVAVAYEMATGRQAAQFGRERRLKAINQICPELGEALQGFNCDVNYLYVENPRAAYKAALREIEKAEEHIKEHGTLPLVCVALKEAPGWPEFGERTRPHWKYAVWDIVNYSMLDEVDKKTSNLPLPREIRESLI